MSGRSGIDVPPPPPPPQRSPQGSWFERLWSTFRAWPTGAQVATAGLAVLLVLVAVSPGQDEGGTQQVIGRIEPEVSPTPMTPSPSVSPSPESESEAVPRLMGESERSATRSLERLGFAVVVKTDFSNRRPGTVVGQFPKGGELEVGDTVVITISQALPRIPGVVGLALAEARDVLSEAGFDVEVRRQDSSRPPCTVLSQTPSAGTVAQPGRQVAVLVAEAPPAATSGGGSNCTPGYSPCLPPASDYDCAGGSGDGPEYTGTVQVTGSDPYGLDSDGDGVGCE